VCHDRATGGLQACPGPPRGLSLAGRVGVLAAATGARLRWVLLAALAVSASVEVLQAARGSGVCDSSDVVRNTVGAAVAAAAAAAVAAAARAGRRS